MLIATRFLAALSVVALVGGCAMFSGDGTQDDDETRDWSAKQLYETATEGTRSGNYERAIDLYQKLEARYPFGPYAAQAQLELAYAYYKTSEPDAALVAADRFLKLHPDHPSADYALYLKGLANFNRDRGLLARIIPPDDAQRDIAAALEAFKDFAALLERFPESKYAQDARQRMLYLRNAIAQHEILVADYYMRREAYVAAANRAKYVVENFSSTSAVGKALVIMARAYERLGLTDLAVDAVRVLELNEPENPALADLRERLALPTATAAADANSSPSVRDTTDD